MEKARGEWRQLFVNDKTTPPPHPSIADAVPSGEGRGEKKEKFSTCEMTVLPWTVLQFSAALREQDV